MLSVLIPTYNYNTFDLAKEIHGQLINSKIDFEILCYDDGSMSKENIKNTEINTLENSKFEVLENNIGRSAIRNLLAKKAKYKWLLFLDADVKPKDNNFIENYLKCVDTENRVFCGGLLYENSKENKGFLRYKFGKKNEEISIERRQKNTNKYFFTSNFLIEKSVFEKVQFEENLKNYGNEDLLFSLNLNQNEIQIKHISNEVYHLGIDHDEVFISKTKKAIENLVFLETNNLISIKDTSLLQVVEKIDEWKLMKLVGWFYPIFEKLTRLFVSVLALNFLKVSYLCYLKSNSK